MLLVRALGASRHLCGRQESQKRLVCQIQLGSRKAVAGDSTSPRQPRMQTPRCLSLTCQHVSVQLMSFLPVRTALLSVAKHKPQPALGAVCADTLECPHMQHATQTWSARQCISPSTLEQTRSAMGHAPAQNRMLTRDRPAVRAGGAAGCGGGRGRQRASSAAAGGRPGPHRLCEGALCP